MGNPAHGSLLCDTIRIVAMRTLKQGETREQADIKGINTHMVYDPGSSTRSVKTKQNAKPTRIRASCFPRKTVLFLCRMELTILNDYKIS